jgi:hypothetical protein
VTTSYHQFATHKRNYLNPTAVDMLISCCAMCILPLLAGAYPHCVSVFRHCVSAYHCCGVLITVKSACVSAYHRAREPSVVVSAYRCWECTLSAYRRCVSAYHRAREPSVVVSAYRCCGSASRCRECTSPLWECIAMRESILLLAGAYHCCGSASRCCGSAYRHVCLSLSYHRCGKMLM